MPLYKTNGPAIGAYSGDSVNVASAESITSATSSQQIALSGPSANVALQVRFSAAPGAFSFILQNAATDVDGAYSNVGTAITSVDGTFFGSETYGNLSGPFIRVHYTTQPGNAVTATVTVVNTSGQTVAIGILPSSINAISGEALTAYDATTGSFSQASVGGAVASVFGRTGAVVAASADYTASQVTGAVVVAGDIGNTAASPQVVSTHLSAPLPVAQGGTGTTAYTPGSLVLLEQHAAASSASLAFTTAFTSTYDEYVIELIQILPQTGNTNLLMRISTDGGQNYDGGGNYNWCGGRVSNGGSGQGGSTTGTGFGLDGSGGVSATSSFGGVSGTLHWFNPLGGSLQPRLTGHVGYVDNASAPISCHMSGLHSATTACNAIQFLYSSGQIVSGTIRIYGIAKS